MIDESRILRRIQAITESLSKLKELARMERDKFLNDFRSIDSAKYNLQTSIEAMIDICNHIIARKRLRVPATNVQSFEVVTEIGLLPADTLPVYRSMARFRNRIVHLYDEVDDSQIHEILQNRLGDIRAFVQSIIKTCCSSS
jgi:uncharacterized protein YutE (UPF0331/DUF86 family)